jgi:hypothetical protein
VTWVKRKLISICLEIVLIWCKIGARFAMNVPLASKSLWAHPMVLLGNVCQVEACFDPFGDKVSVRARLLHGLC